MYVVTNVAAKPGFTAGVVGTALLLPLALIRAVAWADTSRVFVFGHETHWGCWFREHYGVPCPSCGMTRSVVMTLHGSLGQAFQMNAAGPLMIFGLLLFAGTMYFLMFRQQSHTGQAIQTLERRIRLATSAYGGIVIATLAAHWILKLLA